MPAKTGIQYAAASHKDGGYWVPAFAGTTLGACYFAPTKSGPSGRSRTPGRSFLNG
jgi:hypothetical protein